jgi:hypothetical protein
MSHKNATKDIQNFFFLGTIQSAGIGIPCLMIGDYLAKTYTPGIAIGSIIVGNLVLWLIGIGVISMTGQNHINGIQNIKNYIGKLGALFCASIFLFCFLVWFAMQIHLTVENMGDIFPPSYFARKDFFLRVGTALGLLSALLALGGIRMVKWLNTIMLPLLIAYQIFALVKSPFVFDVHSINLSFPAVLTVVLLFLSGTINLPTFFRHSRSKSDSYLALCFLAIAVSFFECSAVWIQASEYALIKSVDLSLAFLFIAMTLTCSNLLNIYFASACYETFTPKFFEVKGLAIIGLLGSAIFALVQIASPMAFLIDLFNCYLLNLVFLLLIAFLIKMVIYHRPRPLEKWINLFVWMVSCCIGTVTKLKTSQDSLYFLLAGVLCTFFLFLTILFIEETAWSIQNLIQQRTGKKNV